MKKLRILVISAQFPPDHSGGYELRIKDIMDGLAARGHEICVLTTKYRKKRRKDDPEPPYTVIRKLHNRYSAKFFPKEVLFDLLDTAAVERQIQGFHPDVIYLGHIYVLSKAILPYLAKVDQPITLDEGGATLKGAWTEQGRWFHFTGDYGEQNRFIRMIKPFIVKMINKLSRDRIPNEWLWPENMRIIINSQHNLDRLWELGIPMENAAVIHSGIDLGKFTFTPRRALIEPITIFCPGRLEMRKGMIDGVHLLKHLLNAGIDSSLSFAGAVGSSELLRKLNEEIHSAGLESKVAFYGMLSQEQLIGLFHQFDICFFPSHHNTGFSRTPLEAMACGCVVISYGNEGSAEVVEHGKNGFLIQEGDIAGAAGVVRELIEDPEQMARMRENARWLVEKNHSLHFYIGRVEQVLRDVIDH